MLFFKFRCCLTAFEYAKYLGHPSASRTDENVDWVKEYDLVVANMLGFYLSSFREFFKDSLNMLWIATKLCPTF
jgi:hypothetical protein